MNDPTSSEGSEAPNGNDANPAPNAGLGTGQSEEADALIAFCLGEYHGREAAGESVNPESFRTRLGKDFSRFLDLLAVDALLDGSADDPLDKLPRDMGPYRLLRRLGRGAMGVVYEAVHRDLGRRAAIKQLFFPQDDVLRGRFRREARACASIRHDHIVEIFETGEADGQLFYAMEFVEGRSLADAIKSVKDIKDPKVVATQFANVSDALHELHLAEIVHRDIKPSNLIYDSRGRLILADFGLASTAESDALTATGEALGTPLYMSPEQILASHDELDGRCDIYGLGVTLFETLTGRPPFQPDNIRALIKLISSEKPPSPRSINPDVPEPLERIILKCMEKEPKDRYATAADLASDLRAYVADETVEGRPVTVWQHRWRGIRKHPWLAAASLLAVAGLSALLITKPWAETTALLNIASVKGATVSVNASDFQAVPYEARIEPGEVKLVLKLDGHDDLKIKPFPVEAGDKHKLQFLGFSVRRGASLKDLDKMAKVHGWDSGLKIDTRRVLARSRSGSSYKVALLYPVGNVRSMDMKHLHAQMGDDYFEEGSIQVRRGGDVLFTSGEVENIKWNGVLPDNVIAKLKAGDELTWGFYPDEGDPIVTTCRVVEPDITEVMARLDAFINDKRAPQPADAAAVYRANVLIKNGLLSGALRVLEDARTQGVTSSPLVATALKVLETMQGDAFQGLEGTSLVFDLKEALTKLTSEPMDEEPSK